MASISSLGVGSGLDAESIVTQLMSLERKSLTSLKTKTQGIEAKISAFGSIKSLIDSFGASTAKFKTLNGFAAFKATSANTEKLGVTASTTATAGSYDVVVKQLAQAAKTSVSLTNTTSSTEIGAGKLNIQVGDGNAVEVEVTSATAKLGDWRDAINRSSAGVTATIIYGQNTAELVLTAKETGKPITVGTLTPAVPGTPTGLSGAVTAQPGAAHVFSAAVNKTLEAPPGDTVINQAGTLTVGGQTVSVIAGQTLSEWADQINTETNGLGFIASVSNDGKLVFTGDTVGESIAYTWDSKPSHFDDFQTDTPPVNNKLSLNLADDDLNAVIGAGKLGITVNGSATEVTVDDTNATLQDWLDAIDTAGVTATVESGKLVITANNPGDTIAVNNSISTVPASYSDPEAPNKLTGPYTVKQAGQLAEIEIDGVTVTSESNTITTAIPGLTLNLLKVTDPGTSPATQEKINITVARDTSATTDALNKFVSDYNALNTKIKSLTAYDTTNKKANTLTGDATVRTLQALLTDVFNSALIPADSNNPEKLLNLPSIGLSFEKNGNLALNSTKLQELITSDFEGVSNVLTTYSTKLAEKTTAMTQTGGMFSTKTESLKLMIKDFGNREDSLNLRLEAIEKRYRAQFSGLDTLVASMQQTSTFLTQQIARLG